MATKFSKSNLPRQLFINNEYVDSKNAKKLTLVNPKDQSEIANDIALAGEEDVDIAVAAAEKALPAWKSLGANKRRNILLKFADLIEENTNDLAELTRITLGAPFEAFGRFEANMAAEVSFAEYFELLAQAYAL
jgi:aldehyde dehydrogenase (NAD+)